MEFYREYDNFQFSVLLILPAITTLVNHVGIISRLTLYEIYNVNQAINNGLYMYLIIFKCVDYMRNLFHADIIRNNSLKHKKPEFELSSRFQHLCVFPVYQFIPYIAYLTALHLRENIEAIITYLCP